MIIFKRQILKLIKPVISNSYFMFTEIKYNIALSFEDGNINQIIHLHKKIS